MNIVVNTALTPHGNDIGQHIVQAACQLITEQSFSGMSMRSLAKMVGLHAGSLYYHFPSKKDVLEEVMDHLHQQRLEAWRREKGKHRTNRLKLEAFIRFNVHRQLYHASEERLLKTEVCYLDPAQQLRVSELEQAYTHELKAILTCGVKEGLFHQIDPEVMAHGILGITSCTVGLKQVRDLPEQHVGRLVSGMVSQLLSMPSESIQ